MASDGYRMQIMLGLWIVLVSLFSTTVMSYVALTTAIGPWMGPTVALISLIVMPYLFRSREQLTLAVCAGSMGGIIATAIGFSYPTLYFLDATTFAALTDNLFVCAALIASLVVVCGLLALAYAHHAASNLIYEQQLAFPIGQLVYKIIDATKQERNVRQLMHGLAGGFLFAVAQMRWGRYAVPLVLPVWNSVQWGYCTIPALRFDLQLAPMLVSIGFIAGHLITVPLLVGTVALILFADPVRLIWFNQLSSADFLFAFCSGIVVAGALVELAKLPYQSYQLVRSMWRSSTQQSFIEQLHKVVSVRTVTAVMGALLLLSWFQFSFLAQFYIICATLLCMHQIVYIAGKIGLALLGRFATFVMVPGVLMFGFTPLQLTLVATFVELAGGIATELLFGLKTAQLVGIAPQRVYRFQLFGLICNAVIAGCVFYFLFTHFQLGSAQLFAQRAQARALLVKATSCDYYVVAVGALFGTLLRQLKLNPMLVLGGLLMPLSLSLSLITGGMISLFIKNKEAYEPFCSGMYAANALAVLALAFF